ncbi:MAG: NAD(P)H-hydrate dehydratase [Deltaproteobacteria bacterium]|nr:NAD(P)H-hydrate dehydratase [Deltaproteobacteria bacterium]
MTTAPGTALTGLGLLWPGPARRPGRVLPAAACVLGRRDVRALDAATIAAGTPALDLMERAGAAIAEVLAAATDAAAVRVGDRPRLLVLAGNGNNAGDGFVVARLLAQRDWDCTVALCTGEPRGGGEAAANLARWRGDGGNVIDRVAACAEIESPATRFEVVLDALLGTGLDRPVDASLADLIHRLNSRPWQVSTRHSGSPLVVAVDVPSGLCADTGRPLGCAVRAALTIALGAYKPGLFLGEGPGYAGRLIGADIGLRPPSQAGLEPLGLALDAASSAGALAAPSPMAHKGSRGHVLVVAASRGKSGAGVLAARAALRSGAGLVTVAVPQSQQPIVAASLPEAMTATLAEDEAGAFSVACLDRLQELIEIADSVVFGPGVGTGEGAAAVLRSILAKTRGPVVLDADALNLAARLGSERRRLLAGRVSRMLGPVIVTPHPGEMGRLLSMTAAEVQASRLELAVNLAKSEGCVVVLKGAGTIITDGARAAFNTSGNAGMATAGMGDVLAGVVAALAARCPDVLDAACLAAYAHGLAGDICAGARAGGRATTRRPGARVCASRPVAGFLAGEVADALPAALAEICAW